MLTTLPPSCADCLELWEPQPPGAPRACPGLYMDLFTFKDQVHPITCHEGTEGDYRYKSTLSLTLALEEGGWLTPRPGSLPLGMTKYIFHRRLGGPHDRSERVRNISPHRDSFPLHIWDNI